MTHKAGTMAFDVDAIRAQFPALKRRTPRGTTPVYFDNPAGTQVSQRVIDAVSDYYIRMNANSGGAFETSRNSDAMVSALRRNAAGFVNASRTDEIAFGPNMTTLNFSLSRALAHTLKPGDEIVLTRMDHDANVNPWLLIARDHNLTVRWVDIRPEDCTLDIDSLEAALSERTRIVATVHASNAVGTINPVQRIGEMARAVGAYFVVDAVQSAPHIPIDVQAIGCDFLLCSAYKFFGPHIGLLWGRYDLMQSLPAYKVRPAKDTTPYRWETGTPSYETLAGTNAALDYLREISAGEGYMGSNVIAYERELVTHLIDVIRALPGARIYGITDSARYHERVPTVAFELETHTPRAIAAHLAEHDIYVWDGNYYAVEIMARLDRAEHGLVRVGLAHYNTHDEIDRFAQAMRQLV